jgi:hypothetical protein
VSNLLCQIYFPDASSGIACHLMLPQADQLKEMAKQAGMPADMMTPEMAKQVGDEHTGAHG